MKKLLFTLALLFSFNSLAQEITSADIIKEVIKVGNFIEENKQELEKLSKAYEIDVQTMTAELRSKVNQYFKEAASHSEYENQKRLEEVEGMEQSIRQYQNQAQQELTKKTFKLLDEIATILKEFEGLVNDENEFLDTPIEINNSTSKSYIGWITKTVNFRKGPGTEYNIIKALETGKQIFVVSNILSNDYYNIIDIESNIEGFVHKSYVEFGDEVNIDEEGILTSTGESGFSQAGVEIFNNTNKTLTLKLNNNNYSFLPQETKTIYVQPGKYDCRASAPGVLPYMSIENLEGYTNYSWKFYIKTKIN